MQQYFTRSDGAVLASRAGFREAVLRARPSGTPQAHWNQADYDATAVKRVADARDRIQRLTTSVGGAEPRRALEIGCGAGLDCLVGALVGLPGLLGIDRDPALLAADDRRTRSLRLLTAAARVLGRSGPPELLLKDLGVEIRVMDATKLELPDASVDILWSRTALEHIQPLDQALAEIARVVRPGGVAHHVIDPFYWLKGCHARGLTAMPWAHARLGDDDYDRFVGMAEGRRQGKRRSAWLRTLNRLTVSGWRHAIETAGGFDILEWDEHHSPAARDMLGRNPDVLETVLPGVTESDLTCSAITTLLRRRRNVQM